MSMSEGVFLCGGEVVTMKDVRAKMTERTRAQVDALYRTVEVEIEVDPTVDEGVIEIHDSSGFVIASYRLGDLKRDRKVGKGILHE